MVAHVTGLGVGDFVHTMGDAHLYLNHLDKAEEQLARSPRHLPQLSLINPPDLLEDFTADHIAIEGYDPHPHIAAKVAV